MKMKFKVCSILGLMTFGFIPILAISSCGDHTSTIITPSPWILSPEEIVKLGEINTDSTEAETKRKDIVKAYLTAKITTNTTPVDALISQLNTTENVAKFISESYYNIGVNVDANAPTIPLYDFLITNFQNLTLVPNSTTFNLKNLEKFPVGEPINVINGSSVSPTNGLSFGLQNNLVGDIKFEYTEPNYLYIAFTTKAGASDNLFKLNIALNSATSNPVFVTTSNVNLQFTSEFFPSFHEWFRTHYLKV